jgi:hypothetical protein
MQRQEGVRMVKPVFRRKSIGTKVSEEEYARLQALAGPGDERMGARGSLARTGRCSEKPINKTQNPNRTVAGAIEERNKGYDRATNHGLN